MSDKGRKLPKYFKFVKKMNLNVSDHLRVHDLKEPKVKYNLHYR